MVTHIVKQVGEDLDIYNKDDLSEDVLRAIVAKIVAELDPTGSIPNLADQIYAEIQNQDPDVLDEMYDVLINGSEEARQTMAEAIISAAGGILGDVAPIVIKNTIDDVTNTVLAAAKAANDNLPLDAFKNATAVVARFSKAMTALAIAQSAITAIKSGFDSKVMLEEYIKGFAAAAAVAIIGTASGLTEIGLVVGVGVTLAAFFNSEQWKTIFDGFVDALQQGTAFATQAVVDAIAATMEMGQAIVTALTDLANDFMSFIENAGLILIDNIEQIIQDGIDAGLSAIDSIGAALNQIGQSISETITDFIDAAVQAGEISLEVAQDIANQISVAIIEYVQDLIENTMDAYNDAIALGHTIIEAINSAASSAADSFDQMLNLLKDALSHAFDSLTDLSDSAAEVLTSAINALNDFYDHVSDSIGSKIGDVAEWVQNAFDSFVSAMNFSSPLIFDLDGDGIELISLANSSIYWDIDEDGFAEISGWVNPDDGFLAIDLDGDGAITNHSELFGSVTEDGFTALSIYDTNLDGIIDANDAQFTDLLVWQDANQNGISEAAELYTLASLNIISINLNAIQVNQINEGNKITHISTYTLDDGTGPTSMEIVDVWFQYDNTNTYFSDDYTLDLASLFITTLRGYGLLPDLHIAATQDNNESDPASLINLLISFNGKEFNDLFVDNGSVMEEIRNIMFRWAGVDSIDPTSRGAYIDARELGFLEAVMGQAFLQVGHYEDPMNGAAEMLKEAFFVAHKAIAARLISQVIGSEIFEGDAHYNPISDTFEGITGLRQDGLDMLLAKAQNTAQVTDKLAFWSDVVRVIDGAIDMNTLSGSSLVALENAITASDATLSTQAVLENLEWGTVTGSNSYGTTGDDVISGTVGDDSLQGSSGNDTLMGGFGDDALNGGSGNDILIGQSGNDYMTGASGADRYLFTIGSGNDSIIETGYDIDTIEFDNEVTASDLSFVRLNNDDIQIQILNSIGSGSITIIDQTRGSTGMVELIEFEDGTVIDLGTIEYTYYGTAGNDILKGVRFGGSQNDTIYGLDGDDTITGYYDYVYDYGENWLYGGNGNDTIYGASGVDFIDGGNDNDYIRGNNGNDELHGGAGDDQILGGSQDDILYGGSGNDILSGENNNDILIGGLGADTLTGGSGNDVFKFLSGESFDMIDTITDFNTTYDAIDISDLLSAYDPITELITDYVQITDNGTDSTIAIDVDGGADNFVALALILGKTGLTDETALEASGKLIAA